MDLLTPDPTPSDAAPSPAALHESALADGPDDAVPHVRIAVIGAGFGGLGMAVRLRQRGITDFVLLERADAVGGTWRDNTYPGCACDVPSHVYSFSFAPNPTWPRAFSGQPDIRAYLEAVTDRFRLRPHIRLRHEVLTARWDETAFRWDISTSAGRLTSDILVSAQGALSEPRLPDIPGLADFPGHVFHSARWDHDHDLTGRRVAVIGTGASAVQFIPRIQPKVASLHVFQRTAPWVKRRPDRPITAVERRLFRAVPAAQKLARGGAYALREATVPAFVRAPAVMRAAQRAAGRHLRRQVPDPALRAKLRPDYLMGCKRILLSNDYYPALTRSNVEVLATGLAQVRGSTLVGADGSEREVDTVIFGTGFRVTDMPIADRVIGRDGVSLATAWADSMQALRGTTVHGFPNLFLIVGPNTGLGHNSMIHIIESQLAYVLDALHQMDRAGLAAIEPTADAQRRWNAAVQQRMRRTVWMVGCSSWYLDAAGRNTSLWPGSTIAFRRATRRVDLAEYTLTRRRARVPTPPVAAAPG